MKIILNEQIWVEKALNSPADINTTIHDQYKKQITPLPQIVLKSQHYQPLLQLSPHLQ